MNDRNLQDGAPQPNAYNHDLSIMRQRCLLERHTSRPHRRHRLSPSLQRLSRRHRPGYATPKSASYGTSCIHRESQQ